MSFDLQRPQEPRLALLQERTAAGGRRRATGLCGEVMSTACLLRVAPTYVHNYTSQDVIAVDHCMIHSVSPHSLSPSLPPPSLPPSLPTPGSSATPPSPTLSLSCWRRSPLSPRCRLGRGRPPPSPTWPVPPRRYRPCRALGPDDVALQKRNRTLLALDLSDVALWRLNQTLPVLCCDGVHV